MVRNIRGGKSARKGTHIKKKKIILPDLSHQTIGRVMKKLGGYRYNILLHDGKILQCKLAGKLTYKYHKQIPSVDNIVLIEIEDYGNSTKDSKDKLTGIIYYVYNPEQHNFIEKKYNINIRRLLTAKDDEHLNSLIKSKSDLLDDGFEIDHDTKIDGVDLDEI